MPEVSSSILPVRLKIPALALDAAIEHVQLDSRGALQVPTRANEVAWFELGPTPGDVGSAVIDGHYGQQHGISAAFDELYKLRKGDKIFVENNDGSIVSFVVRATRRYDPSADASAVFGSTDGKAHLNLVTCEGVWDENIDGYPTRLVVFADRE